MERVCAGSVVVVTPNGFVPQPGTDDEPWQEHRCGFDVAELEALGYDVAGLGGPAVLRGAYGTFRAGPLGQAATRGLRPRHQASPRPRLCTPRRQGAAGVDAETTHASTSDAQGFRRFLKAAGALAMARQVSALVFAGAVLALPLWAPRSWVTDFVWAYFAMLTLTSLLGLGFERLATTVVGERGGRSPRLSSLLVVRVATIPVAAISLWAMMAFVGVSLSVGAWVATLVWVMATLTTLLAFGGLRARKNVRVEPVLLVATRSAQEPALCAVAIAGGPWDWRSRVSRRSRSSRRWSRSARWASGAVDRGSVQGVLALPWRRAFALAGIEVSRWRTCGPICCS